MHSRITLNQDTKLPDRRDEPGNRRSSELQARPAILIVERDYALRRQLSEALLQHGFHVIEYADKSDILQAFSIQSLDFFIIGSLENGSWDGLEIARQIRRSDEKIPIVLIATEPSEDLAIAALRAGINDYFKQPYSVEDLIASINRHLPRFVHRLPEGNMAGPRIIDGDRMIGRGMAMQGVRAVIGRIASTDSHVLVTGETGTGKELVAELIHRNSPRAHQPFVCINCAAIPDGLLESELFGYERGSFTGAYSSHKGKLKLGDGGTIFLDEIGDMSLYAQAKILRVIESREVQPLGARENVPLNVRFIAATNRDLEQSVFEKTFRKDLYYRLNVVGIQLPPLKDRKEDIPSLCEHYIEDLNRRFGRRIEGFTEEVSDFLLRYEWPGNVRELKNLLEAAIANSIGRRISLADLPEQVRRRLRNAGDLSPDERHPLLSILIATNWNISKAAQKLRWSRMTVYRKMAKYHIRRDRDRHKSVHTM